MPTLIPYSTKAWGNGFPFLTEDVDVSAYDHWCTLGGITDSNVGTLTEAQIHEKVGLSIENAVRLYWKLYSVTGQVNGVSNSINVVDDMGAYLGDDYGKAEPRDRLPSIDLGYVGYWMLDAAIPNFSSVNLSVKMYSPIVRMMDGSDFVGLGLESYPAFAFSWAVVDRDFGNEPPATILHYHGAPAMVYLCSYGDDIDPGDVPSWWDFDYGYTVMDGIDFLCFCAAEQSSLNPVALDPANRSAGTDTSGGDPVTIDSITFYD